MCISECLNDQWLLAACFSDEQPGKKNNVLFEILASSKLCCFVSYNRNFIVILGP